MKPFRPASATACALGLVIAALTLPSGAPAKVEPASPVDGPAVSGPIPPLPGVVPMFEPPASTTDPGFVHEGRITFVADPGGVPALKATCSPLPSDPSGTATAPLWPLLVQQALAEADQTTKKLDAGSIQGFFDAFRVAVEAAGGQVHTGPPVIGQRCFAPAPAQARWLRSQYVPLAIFVPGQGEPFYSYGAQPVSLGEIRHRAARVYCAARAANFQQSGVSSMGERAGFTVRILGKNIDFLVSQATLVLDGPERFTGGGANNGAQAFEVPLLLGTRITPIRGLGLPGFREVRAPVSWVVADTEVRTAAEQRPVLRPGLVLQCSLTSGCILMPIYETLHSKTYQTVTHLTRVRSASAGASFAGHLRLFRVGPLGVDLDFGIGYDLGSLTPGNERVIDFAGLPPPRAGRLWVHPAGGTRRHDGPWAVRFYGEPINDYLPGIPLWTVLPDGVTDPFWREPLNLVAPPPLDVRLLHDDDHALDSATTLVISGGLTGELGGSFGPFQVSLWVTGQLEGEVSQHHRLLDAVIAEDLGGPAMTAATALRVRPRQIAHANLDPASAKIRLRLPLPWPFDDIDFTKTLFSVPAVTLAQYDSDTTAVAGDEVWAFQLGTGSARGSVSTQPDARSHLPGGPDFASFPVDVDACLADAKPNPPPPPRCEPTQVPGEPPSAEICIYGPSFDPLDLHLPPNVCANVSGYVSELGFDAEQSLCLEGYLGLLCSPVSKQQIYDGRSVVAHVIGLLDAAQGEAVADVLKTCAAAFGTRPDGTIDTNFWSDRLFEPAPCTGDATLLGPGDVLGAVGDPTKAPPVVQGPPCG